MPDWLSTLLLGLIQGVTEFLPVSSDGHLALFSLLFDVRDFGLTLMVLLHAGTFLATLLVLRARALPALRDGLRALFKPSLFQSTPSGQDALFVLIASVPTALIGLGLKEVVESASDSPTWIGVGFLLTAVTLASTRWAPLGVLEHPGWKTAALVGCAQGLAVLPGLSRSAVTIFALLFLNAERSRAFELSMLMSLPAVFGALLIELPLGLRELDELGLASLASLVAFGSGALALTILRRVVSGGLFPWFSLWVFPLGVATLAMAHALP